MARNQISRDLNTNLKLGGMAAAALHKYEVQVNVLHYKEAVVRPIVVAAAAAQAEWKKAETATGKAQIALNQLLGNIHQFFLNTKSVLEPILGKHWNNNWTATGFGPNTLAIPEMEKDVLALLKSLEKYFLDNPGYEVNNQYYVVTSLAAGLNFTQLTAAREAIGDAEKDQGKEMILRDAAADALYHCLSGLLAELSDLLDDNDPMWVTFGFNMPGAPNIPAVATGLTLTAAGPGVVLAKWDNAAGSTHCKVTKKVTGADADFVVVASVSDNTYTFTAQPTGATLAVAIIASNDGGDALPGDPVTILVP